MEKNSIVIYVEDKTRLTQGQELANFLQLSLVDYPEAFQMVLALTTSRLELRFPSGKMNPLFIDFLGQQMTRRLLKSSGRNEHIARAVGIKGGYVPSVIDATAGLGRDAAILAHLGCHVVMLERSPIVSALLQDALLRAKREGVDWIANMRLYTVDAKLFLHEKIVKQEFVDVVYIDPMFPLRNKSALVKKEMRILKQIVGPDEDFQDLLTIALKVAKKRVIVKRPLHAETTSHPPTFILKGKTCRFDIFTK
jgi:16S rRNA (guanine1516-N2)-methyltransferase